MDVAATSNSALYSPVLISQTPLDVLASTPAKSVPSGTSAKPVQNNNNASASVHSSTNSQNNISINSSGSLRDTSAVSGENTSASEEQVQQEVQRVISELKSRDLEVKAHEQAHIAAGGRHVTGGATYTYQTGPDGKQYAIGGEVGIDTSPVSGDPEATLAKAQQVRAAALAPAEPSTQDLKVASQASQMAAQARAEIAQQNQPKETEDLQSADSEKTSSEASEGDKDSVSGLQDSPLFSEPQSDRLFAEDKSLSDALLVSGMNERNQFEIRLMNRQAG